MKRVLVTLFSLAMAAIPLSAQNVDFGVWATSTTLQGDTVIDEANDIAIGFDEEIGFGATADVFWGRHFSTEVGVYAFEAEGEMELGFLDETISLGSLDITPATLMLRAHFGSDRFDVYAGAGGAYVAFGDLESEDLLAGGTESVSIDDETTWAANLGVSIGVTGNFRIGLDAKWIALEGTAIDDEELEELDLELDPLLLSVGLMWRF